MKIQFSTSTLLLVTAFVGICAGGILPVFQGISSLGDWLLLAAAIAIVSPIWVPALFVGYAVGQRKLTLKTVVCFAISEAAAVSANWVATHV